MYIGLTGKPGREKMIKRSYRHAVALRNPGLCGVITKTKHFRDPEPITILKIPNQGDSIFLNNPQT